MIELKADADVGVSTQPVLKESVSTQPVLKEYVPIESVPTEVVLKESVSTQESVLEENSPETVVLYTGVLDCGVLKKIIPDFFLFFQSPLF